LHDKLEYYELATEIAGIDEGALAHAVAASRQANN